LGDRYIASERIRCDWVLPFIPATKWAGERVQDYDAIVYSKTDPRIFYAQKPDQRTVLDLCDPVWREAPKVLSDALDLTDIVTVPTVAALEDFREAMGEFPAAVVRDGHDLNYYPTLPKLGPKFVWFGYSENYPRDADGGYLDFELDDLLVVSDKDPCVGKFHRWENDLEAFRHISRCQVAIIPNGAPLKSNNREIAAYAMGLAVAREIEDIDRFDDPAEIAKDIEEHQPLMQEHSAVVAANEFREAIYGGAG